MKKIIIIFSSLTVMVLANWTRTNILTGGEYLDDIVNIAAYPNQIIMYGNNLFGDIQPTCEGYGLIYESRHNVGALAIWQPPELNRGLGIGYGLTLLRFDLGIMVSPVPDNIRFGFGIGRSHFSLRYEISFLTQNGINDDWHQFNLRISKKHGDFVFVPRYELHYVTAPDAYQNHTIGIMLQRLVLNDGFVYAAGEYAFRRGALENDQINIYAGLEMPVTRWLVLMCGVSENTAGDFSNPAWNIEPGIGIRIRGFKINFHLNKNRLFDRDQTIFKGAGLDLAFGNF